MSSAGSVPRDAVLIEACVESVQQCVDAVAAGADRLELCGPGDGGTTPSVGVLEAVLERVAVPVHVMIRPDTSSFGVSHDWLDVMRRDISHLRSAGASGVVCGALTASGAIDTHAMRALLDEAAGAPLVFHRAFDQVTHPAAALDTLCDLGVSAILTSGGCPSAATGAGQLREWQARAGARLDIIAGGGVRAHSVHALLDTALLRAVHARATDGAVFQALVQAVRSRG